MIVLRPIELMNILQAIIGSESIIRNKRGTLPQEVKNSLGEAADSIVEFATGLSLKVTATTAKNMLSKATTSESAHAAMQQLGNTLFMELDRREFYSPLEQFGRYFGEQRLFGEAVFNSFPSANEDIYEAGMCLAFERGTACIMHLMRVLEVGLGALAKSVGISKQNDWGSYIRKIQSELDARAKAAGRHSVDEQFYAEATVYFDRLRIAFRNPTMHPDKSYSPDRAEEILLAVKAFMMHLAARIAE